MNNIASKDRPSPRHDEQAPLGSHPSSDEVLDVAVEETFPASDPPAIGASVRAARNETSEVVQPAPKPRTQDPFPWPRGPGR